MQIKKVNYLAFAILTAMALLMFFSVKDDSAIMDELAHIPAGYSYLTEQDYRLNPEHPPLIKDLAAFPLLFQNVYFPTDTKAWQDDVNGQWAQGTIFLYESGNDADRILLSMRTPIMILAIFFGWLFFVWTRKRYSIQTAVMALTFYAFSPTFLAHSRLVTTDLASAFAFFIGVVSFVNFLEKPSWKNVLISGMFFGIAQLLKFSLFLLVPIYGVLLLGWIMVQIHLGWGDRVKLFLKLLGKIIIIGIIGVILIWALYAYHVWGYPPERQLRDSESILSSFGIREFVNLDLWMIQHPQLRPLAQYLLGLLMVVQRVAGGNTTYFLGEVSSIGSTIYFPTMYLLKEPLAFHILTLMALGFAIWKLLRIRKKSFSKILWWARDHYVEVAAWIFIIFYWGYSARSTLNIGVRHLLPTFPFIYLLVSKELGHWLAYKEYTDPRTWYGWLKDLYQIYVKAIPKYLLLGLLFLWLISSTITSFPHFLSYYNELAGGRDTGWRYAVDSNYDWGQDLRRLKYFVEENNIRKINLEYFGGGNPKYYLGPTLEPWRSELGPASGWFALSATLQMGAFGKPAPGFVREPKDSYEWLRPFRPVARAGKSIFIYRLP